MSTSNSNAAELVERLSSSYDVKSQKELAACLGVPAGNVSAWLQRNSVPGSAIIKCALDTGSDLNWLVYGSFTKAPHIKPQGKSRTTTLTGEHLLKRILTGGGKAVVQRVMDAYGFATQRELSDYLGISTGTISTWVRREYFPGDVVITCALETCTSLSWLAIGEDSNSQEIERTRNNSIPKKTLDSGLLKDSGWWESDLTFLKLEILKPILISSNAASWVIDVGVTSLSNGRWLLDIDDKFDIYDVSLLPKKRINVTNKMSAFTCDSGEVSVVGKVVISMEYNF